MKKSDWNKIDKEFIEWDNKTHSNASQKQILDWFEQKFTDQINEAEKKEVRTAEEIRNKFQVETNTFYVSGSQDYIYWLEKKLIDASQFQQPMEYLKECIEKATPNLSKIKDVDKELAEIRGEQPEITDEMISTYFSNHSNCFAKNPIKMPAMTRSAVIDTVKWALSLKAQKPSDEDIEKHVVSKYPIIEIQDKEGFKMDANSYFRECLMRELKAMRDNKIPVSGKDEK